VGGSYGFQKPFPVVPGFEGSGTVVAAGSGLLPRLWMGRRVVCSAPTGGTWAEYLLAPATACFPLSKRLSWEQGAALIVNPMTALAFFDIAKEGKHRAMVSNAAASALGRMILRLGQRFHVPIIHLIRRQEQVELLHTLGGEHILNSSAPDFYDQLRVLTHRLKATLILDPVGGEQSRRLLDAAPDGSTLLTYGSLSGERLDLKTQLSVPGDKQITVFFLPDWLSQKSMLRVLMNMWRVQRLAAHELQTTIQARFPLAAVQQAVLLYQSNPTAGKVLLVADPAMITAQRGIENATEY
jgi:NADPH:quinone reductase-like Zn-dependent oxidoreductase